MQVLRTTGEKRKGRDRTMLKRFIYYYKPHRKMLALDMLASLLISVIGMVYPIVTNKMLNIYIPEKMYSTIVIAGLIVLALYVLRMALRYFVQYYGHVIGVKMQSQMRQDLFAHLEKQPFQFYDNHETGRIMTRITSDLFEVSELAHHGPENLLISSVMIILSFVYLVMIDPILTLIIFACVPILVVVTLHFRKAMSRAFDDRRKSNATINAAVESSVTGIRVTKAYTNSKREIEKFREGDRQFVDASRRAYRAMAMFHSSTAFVTDIFNVFILIAGGLFLYAGRISFGDYSTFIVSVNLFINPVNTLIGFMEQFQNGVSGFKRFLEIMDAEPEKDAPDAEDLTDVQGVIEFKNVTYAYDDSKEVLHDIDLRLEKGRKLALVGPSGGGKTTLCHLLPNFYKLEEKDGSILIEGHPSSDHGVRAQEHRHRPAGRVPLRGHHPGEHPLRPPGRHPGGGVRGRKARQYPRLHHDPGKGVRHGNRRAGREALRRPEAASEHRKGVLEEPGHIDSGRGHQRPGQHHGGTHPAGPGRAVQGAHHAGGGAPPVHHPQCRRDCRSHRRPHHRAGHP